MNHAVIVLCKVCRILHTNPSKKKKEISPTSLFLSSKTPQTLQVQILPKIRIQNCLRIIWKLTIIFDSRRHDVNSRPHLVTVFDDVV